MKQQQRNLLFSLLIATAGIIISILYSRQYPDVVITADSPTYLTVVSKMNAHHLSPYSLVDAVRLPAYPLFIAVVAHSNLSVVTLLQTALFVAISLLTYWIALLTFDVSWIAFVLGFIVATDPVLLGYFRQIMTECLACFLLSSLTLAAILYLRTARSLLLVVCGVLLGALIFTRPEWLALPLLLYPFLLIAVAASSRRIMLLRHISIALIAVICLYACIGAYIYANGKENNYYGFSAVANMNLLGKVLQYHMEGEAPPSQRSHTARLESCITQLGGNRDPWQLMPCTQDLASPWAVPAGRYAAAIVEAHPLEFLVKTIPVFFVSLIAYSDPAPHQSNVLLQAESVLHYGLYECNILFPLLIGWPVWLLWLLWRRRKTSITHTIWILVLLWGITCYGSVLVALAGYSEPDYMRFHTVFSFLETVLLWGSLLLFVISWVKQRRRNL